MAQQWPSISKRIVVVDCVIGYCYSERMDSRFEAQLITATLQAKILKWLGAGVVVMGLAMIVVQVFIDLSSSVSPIVGLVISLVPALIVFALASVISFISSGLCLRFGHSQTRTSNASESVLRLSDPPSGQDEPPRPPGAA
ncbi:hypothetical protein XbrCFBP1976_20925 [Xanthomonas bromi]|uniref:Uncharacterized protein n=1 Tax=Xanthomonas bromi TaxID=56449 RepID=A0ABX5BKE2_9XANT|nr:hypothetical protein XbrCFBP1976_20925 [Xanthomonas bromi]